MYQNVKLIDYSIICDFIAEGNLWQLPKRAQLLLILLGMKPQSRSSFHEISLLHSKLKDHHHYSTTFSTEQFFACSIAHSNLPLAVFCCTRKRLTLDLICPWTVGYLIFVVTRWIFKTYWFSNSVWTRRLK